MKDLKIWKPKTKIFLSEKSRNQWPSSDTGRNIQEIVTKPFRLLSALNERKVREIADCRCFVASKSSIENSKLQGKKKKRKKHIGRSCQNLSEN
jgi:hypothetical protein